MKPDELRKVEAYLKTVFAGSPIRVKALPRKSDSAEVYVGEEFVGTLNKDTDEGETSYYFTMSILEMDLEA
ncbi:MULTISPECIES: DUF3126 family protein [unclassified Aureimonas]|uniref:DUF3126 family protein n=1 Tax=unclassified Aureimonas TaxID=2615206 RepID=UPI0006FB76CC|nr:MULTISPECIES: DUF3126 family protein [unclassified Aureimonas]KQT57517.1 hypothetical protein ASG62_09400 [Aureimonas sp. Leaf427]KQT77197.1 hypothetical protein ASG54_13270 [Aureimonas sp. Leaf460]